VSNAHIVCVGDELLSGDTVDVHGSFLSRFLSNHGLVVERISLVGDDYQAVLGALAVATARSQLVVVTGGLGPTSDDRTRDALGLLVGQELEFDEELWRHIQQTLGRTLGGSNRQQAYRPALFQPLTNARGTAPGLIGEVGGCRVVALPGPPNELRGMIEVHGDQIVQSLSAGEKPATVATCFGIPESRLEDVLRETTTRLSATQPSANLVEWHTRAEHLRIVLRLVGADEPVRKLLVSELRGFFGEERLADGETTLAEMVVTELATAGLMLSAAESCTGGLFGAALTDVAGSSNVFWGTLVTYANSAKIAALGVKAETLNRFGAVSEETVIEMAQAVRSMARADLSISISGVAGPEGGTPEKPVGTVWIALDAPRDCMARAFQFSGDRGRVRRAALTEALLMIRTWVQLA
jgi:nicotinamide-nucleotide amidase